MLPLQLLRVSVHERISAAAADFLLLLEKGREAAEIPELRALLTERLTAAAEEIVGLLEKTVAEYEDKAERAEQEMCRQRKLLNILLKPQVRLHRAVFPPNVQQLSIKTEESSVDQEEPEPPHIKEEEEELWTNQEAEQLHGLTTFPVKSEDDEEEAQSETETEDSEDDWKETREAQAGSDSQNKALVGDNRFNIEDKPFSCSVCGKAFQKKPNMQKHMRVHSGEKKFSCSVCAKCFRDKGDLIRHMRIHTGERPYSCSVCSKRFNHSSHVVTHMRIHTGEKPYGCGECGERFGLLSTLKRHRRSHAGEKPYGCSACGRSFYRREHLRKHLRRAQKRGGHR